MSDPILAIRDLHTVFEMSYGKRSAVEGVDLVIYPLDKIGIAGESGCGKSTLAMNILRILPKYAKNPKGEILFKGKDLLKLSEKEMQQIRGDSISMVFQEPMTALSPVHKIGYQIIDVIQTHDPKPAQKAFEQAVHYLSLVKIPNPREIMHAYPHQLSGGMRQRVMIAMALACSPDLLLLDEPTSALDTVIQMELISVLEDLEKNLGMTMMLISHNLHLIKRLCNNVGIMYLGRIVEFGTTQEVMSEPKHPYTQGLIQSIPNILGQLKEFHTIPGDVPDALRKPKGCTFHPRCPYVMPICRTVFPPSYAISPTRKVACYLYEEKKQGAQDKASASTRKK